MLGNVPVYYLRANCQGEISFEICRSVKFRFSVSAKMVSIPYCTNLENVRHLFRTDLVEALATEHKFLF